MLVINRNRVVGSEALIDAVWGQRARQEARASVHTYVSNLRRLLNDAGVDGRTVLAAAPSGYRLSAPDIDCDIGRFVSEKAAGTRAAAVGHFELASRHLSAAVTEWRGRVLEDLSDFEFAASFPAALIEDEVDVHTARAEVEIACGRCNAVISTLEGLVAQHPYREPLWAQLTIAYYIAERQSDALDALRRLKTTLSADLGIEPGPTIRDLHERILRQETLDVRRAALTAASVAASTLDRRTTAAGPTWRAFVPSRVSSIP
jgi:SARP family transcriptional regulator, regulator of embCAB operon